MQSALISITTVSVYAIFVALGLALVVAIIVIGAQLAWGSLKANFLSPAYEIVRALRGKAGRR